MALFHSTLLPDLSGTLTGMSQASTDTWFSMESCEGRRMPEEE